MEKSTLNGTTTNDQAWKEKKGFAPLIMLTALLLGLAFYAGQMSGGGTVATRGGAKASMMSFDAFESMMSGTQDCDHDCCLGQKCDPSSATSCGKGKPQCDYSIITCTLQTPKIPVPVPVYRCQSGYWRGKFVQVRRVAVEIQRHYLRPYHLSALVVASYTPQ